MDRLGQVYKELRALQNERDERIAQAREAIEAEYAVRVSALRSEAWRLERELEAERIARSEEWVARNGGQRVLLEVDYNNRLTGRRGVLEVWRRDSQAIGQHGARPGDIVIRLLRRNGQPSRRIVRIWQDWSVDGVAGWVPEGER